MFWKIALSVLTAFYLVALVLFPAAESAPFLANYYLGALPTDQDSLAKLSKTQLLILTPDQTIRHPEAIAAFRRSNPNGIILAYVPSQSYNTRHWANDIIFRHLNGIKNDWWLKDTHGHPISPWPDLQFINMNHDWSEYLVSFINQHIANLPGVDGIFFDMVNDGIAGLNGGDVDIANDGTRTDPTTLNRVWLERVNYLLAYAQGHLQTKYIVMNGTSLETLQPYVNGRMYETFPTPWEAGGSWSGLMTRLAKNQALNRSPQIYVFNGNTNNTGRQNDYKNMRFGLASSLLLDHIYFGFDFGDTDHQQVWWYDEYNAPLGDPLEPAQSLQNLGAFQDDVWRRRYTHGIALVNPTSQAQDVDLGEEYEKVIGTQDPLVNDGSIVDRVHLAAHDGIIMMKTVKKINDVFFKNGSFIRFYRPDGARARNGFFAFEDGRAGGAKIFHGDLAGDGQQETIVATGPRLEIFDNLGRHWFDSFPYGPDFKGELNIAVGKLLEGGLGSGAGSSSVDGAVSLVVAPSVGRGEIQLYNYHGGLLKEGIYPLGKKFTGGFSVAIAHLLGSASAQVVVGVGVGRPAEVLIYNKRLNKIERRFFPFDKKYTGGVNISAGNFRGLGSDFIAVSMNKSRTPIVRVFDGHGQHSSEFSVGGLFGTQTLVLGALDVNFEGKDEIVVVSEN